MQEQAGLGLGASEWQPDSKDWGVAGGGNREGRRGEIPGPPVIPEVVTEFKRKKILRNNTKGA